MFVYSDPTIDNTSRDAATLAYLLNFKRGIKSQWRLERGETSLHKISDPHLLAYTFEAEVPHSQLLSARASTTRSHLPILDYTQQGIKHVVVEWHSGEVLTMWGCFDKLAYSTSVFYWLYASPKSTLYSS